MRHHYFTWSLCKCTIISLHGVDVNAPSLVLHEARCKCTIISFTRSSVLVHHHYFYMQRLYSPAPLHTATNAGKVTVACSR